MTDIHRARDVLQRWRDDSDGSSPGTWRVDATASIFPTVRDQNRGEVAESLLSEDARLIVGTAGNPDLLDAVDVVLCQGTFEIANRFAAAILSADERMRA